MNFSLDARETWYKRGVIDGICAGFIVGAVIGAILVFAYFGVR